MGKISTPQDIIQNTTRQVIYENLCAVSYNISNAINTSKNFGKLFGIIRDSLGKVVDTINFFIVLYDKRKDTILFPNFLSKYGNFSSMFSENSLFVYYAVKSKQLIIISENIYRELVRFGALLKVGGEVIGVIVLADYNNPNRYTEANKLIIELISNQITLVINRKKLEEDLVESENRLRYGLENSKKCYLSFKCTNQGF